MENVVNPADSQARYRVLFLRSHSNICGFSFIANGLCNSQTIEFAQYPPFPSHYRSKLQKLPHREKAWHDLNRNLITSYHELSEKLQNRYFDLVLLADYNAQLTHYHQIGWFQKIRTWAELVRNRRGDTLTQYKYLSAFPLSVAELCRVVPVIVVDLIDHPYLSKPTDVELLKNCLFYFKREIPYNRFVLYHAFFQFSYLSKAGKDETLVALLDKVQSIPLGIPMINFTN